jgi:hypothetical protein
MSRSPEEPHPPDVPSRTSNGVTELEAGATPAASSGRSGGKAPALADLIGLAVLFAVHFWTVKPSNMGGYEWLNVHLASRGITDFPHTNRPLTLLWHLPPALLWPHDLRAYLVAEWVYFLAAAGLLYALLRYRLPAWPGLALLATTFALTWVPMDHARLQSTVVLGGAGSTLSILGILLLFLESWRRRSTLLLLGAALCALALSRVSEAVLPILFGAPLLLTPPWPWRRLRTWLLVWWTAILGAAAAVLAGLVGGANSYQASLGFDPHPARVLVRLGLQFWFHLVPLAGSPPRELGEPAVAAAVAVFGLIWWRSARAGGEAPVSSRGALVVAGLGLVFAALGYAAFVLGATFVTPERTQVLAAPGIAAAVAGLAYVLASWLPVRTRALALGVLGAWVVAVGTGRTIALQRDWDLHGRFPAQRALLAELVALAPDVRPHTLVVLLDPARTFPAVYPFRHAVEYVYARRASGLALDVPELFYPYSFGAEGVRIEPLETLRDAWDEPATLYRYDELMVVARRDHGLALLEEWPRGLPPLPDGARYDPRARVVSSDPRLAARAILAPR